MRTSPSRPTRTISQPAYLTEFVTEVLSHRSRSSQGQAVPSGPARRTRARAAQQADQHDRAGAGLGGGEGCDDEDGESVNGEIGESEGEESSGRDSDFRVEDESDEESEDDVCGDEEIAGEDQVGGVRGGGRAVQAAVVLDPTVGGAAGELLAGRVSPAIPTAGPVGQEQADADGWGEIDKLGAFDCMLCEFAMLDEVPMQHQEMWGEAWSQVLQRLEEAGTDEEETRALKWFMFLPQALLRKASRGGRAGRGQVARRFNALVRGDWGAVVVFWLKDKERREGGARQTHRQGDRDGGEEDETERVRREAVKLISKGQISKAVSRLNSHGVADISDPIIMQQLREKYPDRVRDLPGRVEKGYCVDGFKGLREDLLGLEKGVAPGTGGLRNEYLNVLGERMTNVQMNLLEGFGLRYVRGELPEWFSICWLTVQTIALYKSRERSAVRPIGIRNPLAKSFHRQVIQQNKPDIVEYLEPQQLSGSKGCAAKLVFSVRGLSEVRRDFVVVKLDLRNAFNQISRTAIIENLIGEPSLKHLAWFASLVLVPETGLESRGTLWGRAKEGATQGDPPSSPLFCVGIHPYVRQLDAALGEVGGMAKFGMDDGYLLGPPQVVFPAMEIFEQQIRDHCGLELERSKTEVFSWDGVLPRDTPDGLVLAGKEVDGEFLGGYLCYGIPVGCDQYVRHMLAQKVEEVAIKAERAVKVLAGERQSLWAVLKWSVTQQMDYWLQLSYPSDMSAAGAGLDRKIWRVLEATIGSKIPEGTERGERDCVLDVPVDELNGLTFQQVVVRLPVRLGGLGIKSLVQLSPAAFAGPVEQCVPQFSPAAGAVCPQLSSTYGGDECFSGAAPADTRWRVMVSSGCRLGLEYGNAWEKLQEEGRQSAGWLDTELGEALTAPVVGAGRGSTTGSTRKEVVELLDKLRGEVLKKALSEYPDRAARPVWAWLERDKISASWLLALPGSESGLDSQVFAEAPAALLCLPSPACSDKIGCRVGDRTVDLYGNRVQAAKLEG